MTRKLKNELKEKFMQEYPAIKRFVFEIKNNEQYIIIYSEFGHYGIVTAIRLIWK